jgi:hypothetical protein
MDLANKLKVGTGMQHGGDPWAAPFNEWDKILGQDNWAKPLTTIPPKGQFSPKVQPKTQPEPEGGLMSDVMEALRQLQENSTKGGY